MPAKRNIFGELMEGVDAMKAHRERRITLRSYNVEPKPLPAVTPAFIKRTRRRLKLSRGVFARRLYANARTLENWEQGRGKPNAQAVALMHLVNKYPDTLDRLDAVAARGQR
jgi:putative transcriptional regulator